MTAGLVVAGLVTAVVMASGERPPRRAAVVVPTSTPATTSTTVAAQVRVLGAAEEEATTTTTAAVTTAAPASTTTVAERGRIYGYSFPSEGDHNFTSVTITRGSESIGTKRTTADGFFEFRDLPAGTYTLFRTTRTSSCPSTTTTGGDAPKCSAASSRGEDTTVALPAGGEVRADVF